MINKQNGDDNLSPQENKDGFVDNAHMDVQLHFVIKDKDTGEELVNKRG